MILPTPSDVLVIATTTRNFSGRYMRYVLDSVCRSRNERAPTLVVSKVLKPCFQWSKWRIVVSKDNELDFWHELAHLISLFDSGTFGSDEEAEMFAHGCYLLRHQGELHKSWDIVDDPIIRGACWTAHYMTNIVDILSIEDNDFVRETTYRILGEIKCKCG